MSDLHPEAGGVRVVEPMAPRGRRTAYAYGYVAGVAIAAAGAVGLRGVASALVQLAGFAVLVVLWFTLRRSTRLVLDARDGELADRYARLRDKVYLLAYQVLAVVVFLVSVVLFLASRGGLSEPVATALAWAALGSAFGLPLVVAAVSLPDTR